MNYLLDTNVVSEWTKPRPNPGVVKWLSEAEEDATFISVITLAELRNGIERLPPSSRRQRLNAWLVEDILIRFETRILPIEIGVADAWGRMTARRTAVGRPIGVMDGLVAATAAYHGLALVSRNTIDFRGLGLRLIDPWTD